MSVADWLDPVGCPEARPPLARMAEATQALHSALDEAAKRDGVAWLHPTERTVQLDLLGSPGVIAWQEAKAAFLMEGEGAWSALPPLYARYGTAGTTALIGELRRLYSARCAFAVDSGMQAVALVADALLDRGDHVVVMRQVYNKSRAYLERAATRLGGDITVVDDGDEAALSSALRASTRLVFAETYTNPRMRAQDVNKLARLVAASPRARLVVDDTIASPWGLHAPLLASGAHVVVGSATKSLSGQDTGLGGYIVTNDSDLGNAVMDLIAMRGGILDDRRALALVHGLAGAEAAHARRCASASRVAAFLTRHPQVEEVFHPSLPDHPDAALVARDYARTGSIVSFRVRGADEAMTRHLADVLCTCIVPRYALSFDGLATKVNHHRTVSEYFTPEAALARSGFDRLIRLGVGMEDADDLLACLNWALHHAGGVSEGALDAWRAARAQALGLR